MPHRWISILIVASLLVSTTGCASVKHWWNNSFRVGPNYWPPTVPVAEAWVDSEDHRVSIQNEEQANWWQVFNDPDLDQLVRVAYQRNLSLRVAGLRVLEARRQRDITAANLFPQSQSMFGSYVRNQVSRNQATSSPLAPRSFGDFQTGFDLSWEIDVWGRIRRAIEASDASIEALSADYDDVLVTLIGDVAATYIEIRTFDERLTLAEQNIDIQDGSLEIATKRKAAGKVSELDVQEATANLADTRALIPSLEQGRRQAVNRMVLLLGMVPSQLDPILAERGRLPTVPSEVIVGIPAELLRRRPDIRAAEQAIAVQSAQIGIAEAELFPQFALGGQIGFNAEKLSDLVAGGSNTGFISPGFSWKILNYGRLKTAVEVERIRFQQQVVTYENAVLAAHREVEDALVEFIKTKERVEQLEISTEATAKTVEIVRTKYKEGATDFGRVFVLEGSLVQRQDQLVAAKAQIAIALTQAYKALGGGWQVRCEVPEGTTEELMPFQPTIVETSEDEPIFQLDEPTLLQPDKKPADSSSNDANQELLSPELPTPENTVLPILHEWRSTDGM